MKQFRMPLNKLKGYDIAASHNPQLHIKIIQNSWARKDILAGVSQMQTNNIKQARSNKIAILERTVKRSNFICLQINLKDMTLLHLTTHNCT